METLWIYERVPSTNIWSISDFLIAVDVFLCSPVFQTTRYSYYDHELRDDFSHSDFSTDPSAHQHQHHHG